jgi:hypothetical protein
MGEDVEAAGLLGGASAARRKRAELDPEGQRHGAPAGSLLRALVLVALLAVAVLALQLRASPRSASDEAAAEAAVIGAGAGTGKSEAGAGTAASRASDASSDGGLVVASAGRGRRRGHLRRGNCLFSGRLRRVDGSC